MSNANEFFMDWLGGEAFTRQLSVPRNTHSLQTSSSLLVCNNFILVSAVSLPRSNVLGATYCLCKYFWQGLSVVENFANYPSCVHGNRI